ncbi:MAG: dTDP-4-dehydrorhamnose reductase [Nitrosotalea sp.]
MRIVILGKNGQLGEALVRQFKKTSIEVFAFGHNDCDIANFSLVEKKLSKISPDVIINTTAFHVVPLCETNPQEAFLVNASAVKNLAEICRKIRAVFVTISTDYVFDGLYGKPNNETTVPNPVQVYGISKLAGEHCALAYNPKTYVIRTCGVYGGKEGSRSKKGNFVLSILSAINKKESLEVSSEQIVNPTYTVDIANAIRKILNKNLPFGIYHLTNEGYCSWADFAKEIIKLSNGSLKIVPVDRHAVDKSGMRRPKFSALANTKAKKHGISLPVLEDALKRYLRFLSQS